MEELLRKLHTGSTNERIAAVKALGELGDPSARPALREILNGLTEPYEETNVVPGGWGNYYDAHPEQTRIVDPDRELREAIMTTINQLG